jgi:7-cyano-7-deazaguanine synthase
MTEQAVAIVSGGLDSTTLLYSALEADFKVHAVSFDYGQRHGKELDFAQHTCDVLGVPHDIIDLTGITDLISNSALTQGVDVPDGHYAEENMKQTVVPNRNMIMLAIAGGVAVNESAEALLIGVHAGDHFIYPDCRPRFIAAANATLVIGNEGFGAIGTQDEGAELDHLIAAPFLSLTKEDIAFEAIRLGVPFEETWSCYKGGDIHCGRCGTCVERLEAIEGAARRKYIEDGHLVHLDKYYGGEFDKTEYADNDFWKTVTKSA